MDELKEVYGMEMSNAELKRKAYEILTDEYLKANSTLERVTNARQRIDALRKQKAIEYVLKIMGETE